MEVDADEPSETASRPCASGSSQGGQCRRPDDPRQPAQLLGCQAKFLDHHVECAEFAAMAPEHILDIEERCTEPCGNALAELPALMADDNRLTDGEAYGPAPGPMNGTCGPPTRNKAGSAAKSSSAPTSMSVGQLDVP